MRNNWCECTFSDLIGQKLLEIGDGYRAKLSELGGSGPIFLRAGHVTDTHIDFTGVDRFQSNRESAVAPKTSRAGDVIVTTKGNSTGRVAFVHDGMPSFVYSPHLSYWRSLDTETISPNFLRYWSRSSQFRDQLVGLASSTDMAPYLSLIDQRCLRITLPPPDEQRAIAHILSSLDDKIELNRRMNETLEAIALAIFKSWFVDFDPVRAKAEGRQPFGMDAATASLFPDSFEDSELGKIPTGWKAVPLSAAFEINPPRPLAKGQGAPYLDMQNMPTAGHRVLGWIQRSFMSGSRFANGDTLVARITPCLENGETAYVDFLDHDKIGWGSTEFIVLRPRPSLPPEYGYCLARSEEFRIFAVQSMTGSSGRQRVPTDCFYQFSIAVPAARIAERFGEIVRPMFEKMKANSEESENIAAIRDALLPKLISGEIRVNAARELVDMHT